MSTPQVLPEHLHRVGVEINRAEGAEACLLHAQREAAAPAEQIKTRRPVTHSAANLCPAGQSLPYGPIRTTPAQPPSPRGQCCGQPVFQPRQPSSLPGPSPGILWIGCEKGAWGGNSQFSSATPAPFPSTLLGTGCVPFGFGMGLVPRPFLSQKPQGGGSAGFRRRAWFRDWLAT